MKEMSEKSDRYFMLKEFVRYCDERITPHLTAQILIIAGNFMDDVNEKRFHLRGAA